MASCADCNTRLPPGHDQAVCSRCSVGVRRWSARCSCGRLLRSEDQAKCRHCRTCKNCKRRCPEVNGDIDNCYSINVQSYAISDYIRSARLWKFAFIRIGDRQELIELCTECKTYLDSDKSDENNGPEHVWPAFVWSVLQRPDTVEEAWALVPADWRRWWLDAFCDLHDLSLADLEDVGSLFLDVTYSLQQDSNALDSLLWRDLMDREKSLVLPEVKCPAGCSEFKHRSNELPFDIVWEECLQVELDKLISKPSMRAMTRWFRRDYLVPDMIATNEQWPCTASIAKVGGGAPAVLCCRFHSKTTAGQMIHPGHSPSGCMSSPDAGALSPVVPVPRTLQKARMSGYSASFQMAYMEGSYYGVDTMYLSSSQNISSVHSPLGWWQDVLSYAGRHDVRAFTRRKYSSTWGVQGSIATAIDNEAALVYPYLDEMKEKFGAGASFVALDSAVEMQTNVDFGKPETGWYVNEHGTVAQTQFKGHYPQNLVWAHPAADRTGSRPPIIPKFGSRAAVDTRLAWLMASLMLLVPEIWSAVASVEEKKDWNWEGHLLTFLATKYLPHISPNSSRVTPFPKGMSESKLVDEFLSPGTAATGPYAIEHLAMLFNPGQGRMKGVTLAASRFPSVIAEHQNIVIVTRDYTSGSIADLSWVPPMKIQSGSTTWKLCYIAETRPDMNPRNNNSWDGEVFCRYSSAELTHWWRTTRRKDLPVAVRGTSIPTASMSWDVCVYVTQESYTKSKLRDQVMASCGGQDRAYCARHNYPLITAPKTDTRTCICSAREQMDPELCRPCQPPGRKCGLQSIYACTIATCDSAICKKHHSAIASGGRKFFTAVPCHYGTAHPNHNIDDETMAANTRMPFLDNPAGLQNDSDPSNAPCDESDDSDAEEIYNDFGDMSNDGEDEQHRTNASVHDSDDEPFEAYFRLRENLDDDVFVAATLQGLDAMEDIEPIDPGDIAVAAEDLEAELPTTAAGTLPIYCATDGDYGDATINNHVILNNFGHMLIRRNRKLAGTLNQKHFLQRLVSRMPGESLPLIYPEGMLFANTFPTDTIDGSIVGAIPSCLLNSERVVAELGFCSLEDHYRTRMSNPGLLASSNPTYHLFAFDCLANLGLRGCDSRIILRRGFAEHQKKGGGVRFKGKEEPIFDTEHVDSRPIVNQLAAAVNEDNPTYFYTHTCSMRTHFGMKVLWDWIAGDDVINNIAMGWESPAQRAGLRRTVIDGSGVLLLRAWMEMMHIWIRYITKSPEQPLGEVTKFLFRMELQDAMANLPHLHALIWTMDDLKTEEGLRRALDRIRGFISDIIRPEERERYINEGVFENDEAIVRFLEMMQTFLAHHHTRRCFIINKNDDTGDPDNVELKCKANNNYKDNPCPGQHSLVDLPIEHSEEAMEILTRLGLAEFNDDGKFVPLAECLKPIKHYPPAHGDEGIISPVFGALAARNPNMGNSQFATGYTLSRYLAKYIVMVDLYNTIKITPPEKHGDPDTFTVHGRELPNQKITGNRIGNNPPSQQNNNKTVQHRQGRGLNVAEFYMMLFGYDPIMTNMEFVRVETKSFEERAATERIKPIDRIGSQYPQHTALTALNCIPSHHARRMHNLPQWRQFRDSQLQLLFDDLQSPLAPSAVTRFSARPPELAFVARQSDYFRWFVDDRNYGKIGDLMEWALESTTAFSPGTSLMLDGFTSHIKIRAAALPEINAHLRARSIQWFAGYNTMTLFFRSLNIARNTPENNRTDLQKSLLDMHVTSMEETRLPIIWYESVRPTRTSRFLVHLILSMGNIRDEYELFAQPTIRHSFIAAGLLDINQPADSAQRLVKDYVLQQLACLPAGTRTFDRYLMAAYQTITGLFVHDRLNSDDLPSALYTHARQEMEDSIVAHLGDRKQSLVRYLTTKLSDCAVVQLPTTAECLSATLTRPCNWDPTQLPRVLEQPEESYTEQRRSLALTKSLVLHYKTGTVDYTKGVCHVGAGGVGKTTVLLMEILYVICQGLTAGLTAMLSERAQELSGAHLHELFCLPARDVLSPGQMAERACSKLYRSPEKLEYLRCLDVLGLDEAGAIPCEILAAMCHILRYVRKSNRPFGGLLLLATMDYLQIDPVSGRHPLMSPTFTTCFYFRELLHSVRAAFDEPWRRIQAITRLPADELASEEIRDEFVHLLTTTCTFVDSPQHPDVPKTALFAFGKKAPIRTQERRILEKLERQNTTIYRVATANDEQRTIDGNFEPASDITSRSLDKQLKEPRRLVLYQGGRYQITYNSHGNFSNSQLAILFDVPDQDTLDNKRPIKLMVAPAGSRLIPDESITKEELSQLGWIERAISTPRRNDVHNAAGSVRGRRRQYGLRHHIGSTIHGIMGQTLISLITRVERGDKTHPYSLWLAAQVVVLLSRTRFGRDTYFWVTANRTPEDIAQTIYDILSLSTRFRDHLTKLLRALCCEGNLPPQELPYTIDHSSSIFRLKDIAFPSHRLGYVYLLVSTRDLEHIYIGATYDLLKRFGKHNAGFGAVQTTPARLRPWGILAYVVGFDGIEHKFKDFERTWILAKNELLANPNAQATVQSVHHLGKDLVATHNRQNPADNLQFVSCGTIERIVGRRREGAP